MKQVLKKNYIYMIAFFLPIAILIFVYALRGVYPIGKESVLVLDLNAQYVYYYEAFRDAFLGNKSLFYSFSRSLGGEMIGIYAYYLASPFSFVFLLFPKDYITEAVLTLILCKVGSASLTFFLYIKKSKYGDHYSALIFSLLYALMGYVIVQTMNPMWLDAVVFLPLLVLGVERLIDKSKPIMFITFLTLIFISNFYIGYMVGIFIFIYFLYYIYGGSDQENVIYKPIKSLKLFAMSGLIATMMSIWLIYPTYNALKMGKFTFTNPDFFPKQQLDLFDLFAKLLPLSYDSVNYQGFPFIYCGLIVIILCGIYFMNKNILVRKKIAAAIFIFAMILSFTISTIDIVLHGFQGPNWLNYRYSFILSFFLIRLAYDSYKKLSDISGRIIVTSAMIIVLLIALTGRNGYTFIIPENAIWFSYTALLIYSLLLYGIKTDKRLKKNHLFKSALMFLIITELILNSLQMIDAADAEVSYSDRPSYREYFDNLKPAIEYIEENDNGFYRSETVMRRSVNDPMSLGIYGLSNSSSILNSSVIDFLHVLGMSAKEHWTRYKGATIISDSILGVKYILSEKEINTQYKQVFIEEDVIVNKNPYVLPILFVASNDYKNIKLESENPFINQNELLNGLLGEKDVEYFKQVTIKETILENMSSKKMKDCISYSAINKELNAHIEYILETKANNPMYMYLYSEYPRTVNLWKDKEFIDTFFESESTCTMPLGNNPDKETISIITTPAEDEYYLTSEMFYYLDIPLFEKAISRLQNQDHQIEKVDETHINIVVTAKKDDLLFTSIPYEKGWTAKCNGIEVDIIETVDSLMAIELREGKQEIELYFVPYGFVPGVAISLMGLLLFLRIIVIDIIKKKGKS